MEVRDRVLFQRAYETELGGVSVAARQLEAQPAAAADWLVFHASLRLLQAIGGCRPPGREHWRTGRTALFVL